MSFPPLDTFASRRNATLLRDLSELYRRHRSYCAAFFNTLMLHLNRFGQLQRHDDSIKSDLCWKCYNDSHSRLPEIFFTNKCTRPNNIWSPSQGQVMQNYIYNAWITYNLERCIVFDSNEIHTFVSDVSLMISYEYLFVAWSALCTRDSSS